MTQVVCIEPSLNGGSMTVGGNGGKAAIGQGTTLSVERYHALICAGKLTEDDSVELLEGRLVPKMPKNPHHTLATGLLRKALERVEPEGWYVESQEPVTLQDGEPEPDGQIVRGTMLDYTDRHPGPRDLAMVVEVSDTTLAKDRLTKKRSYARAGIPVYWILNLNDRQLEAFWDPSGPTKQPDYQHSHVYQLGDTVPVWIGGTEVASLPVRDLLPP